MSENGPESYPKGLRRLNPNSKRPISGREMGPTRDQTLKSAQPDQERFQGDLKDAMSGSVRRIVHGREVSLPKTAQPGMQCELDIGVTNRDRTRSLPLTDQLIEQSLDGYQDRRTLRKVQKQKGAITDSVIKAAEKAAQKPKPPTEH